MPGFTDVGATVVGVSRDSLQSHKKFSEKLKLPFSLLVDDNNELHHYFDVLKEKKMFGKKVMGTERSTFILDHKGVLIKEFRGVKATGHAETVLEYLKHLEL